MIAKRSDGFYIRGELMERRGDAMKRREKESPAVKETQGRRREEKGTVGVIDSSLA